MKRILFSAAALFLGACMQAQISTLPATQSFDAAFSADSGTNIEVYPSYFANEVQPQTRIFREIVDFNSAPAALSLVPTGSFDGNFDVHFNLTAYSSVGVSFVAKSRVNGDGTRPTALTMSTSIDGGTTWIGSQAIGSFPNQNQSAFANFSYTLPAAANNQANVVVRFTAGTGVGGSGTRAKLVIDDVAFAVTAAPQIVSDETAMVFTQVMGVPSVRQTAIISGVNLTSGITLTTAAPYEISLSETSGYTTSLTLAQTGGSVAATTIYVRQNATVAGASVGTVSIQTTGAAATIALTGTTVVPTATNPVPFVLAGGDYVFTAWSADAAMNTYPANMAFWTHATTDPITETLFVEDYHCLYNLTGRSRFNGLGEGGVSMINTGNSQFTGVCDGSDPTQIEGETVAYGRAGAVVLALNATNRQNVIVNWTGKTILKNNRVYSLRLQYRIGATDVNSNWMNVTGPNDAIVQYTSGETDDTATFATSLPSDVNGQPVVQVRWVYNFVDTGVTGSRAQVALDNVTVTSSALLGTDHFNANNGFAMYPNPATTGVVNFNRALSVSVYDYTGKQVLTAANTSTINVSGLSAGLYLVKTTEGATQKLLVK